MCLTDRLDNIFAILVLTVYLEGYRFLERKLRLKVNEKKSKVGLVEECGFLGFRFCAWQDQMERQGFLGV